MFIINRIWFGLIYYLLIILKQQYVVGPVNMLKSPSNQLGARVLTLRRSWDKRGIKQRVINKL